MNIFIIILVFLFMAGWYFMDSPNQKIADTGIEYAADKSEKSSLLTCISHVQQEAVQLDDANRIDGRAVIDNDTECATKYNVITNKVCAETERRLSATCIPEKAGKQILNYIITTAPAINDNDTGKFLDLLAANYSNIQNFGVLTQADRSYYILSGNGEKREVLTILVQELKLTPGQLVYMTQYAVTGKNVFATGTAPDAIKCAGNEIKLFRFNKWQCMARGTPVVCSGDTIWDTATGACVSDPSRRPLCAANQTAVMNGDYWECKNPILQTTCPPGQSAHLDYSTMTWVCAADPAATKPTTKCAAVARPKPGGVVGTTLTNPIVSCNDCEEMVTDPDTCETACVPSAAAVANKLCYGGTCSGAHRAFYFGFPNPGYARAAQNNIPAIANAVIPMDGTHSQNRKFNCLDCGTGYIDTEASVPPFVAVCK
ncbi:MAG: hypothetical protein FWC51_03400 [Proteobacteria bacterium]|nr:hypothetical protein [Pseudomonadota bacterium]